MPKWRPGSAGLAALITGSSLCVIAACTLEPHYETPAAPVAARVTTDPTAATTATTADLATTPLEWRAFYSAEPLQRLIALALANNRDLRVAALNVERARALYRIQRADLLPTLTANGDLTRQRLPPALSGSTTATANQYAEVSIGVTAFELDLFGRIRSLSRAALEQYLALEASRRSVELSLVATVADAYLTLAADGELRQLAQRTLRAQEAELALTERRHQAGAASALELAQARTSVEAARADAAHYAGTIAQDRDALMLLIGAAAAAPDLPDSLDDALAELPAPPSGLASSVLLRRPDVASAEHGLRAANANIGAARAAFFPSLSLTGDVGSASSQLSGLFRTGTGTWLFEPQLNLPLFAGGRHLGALAAAGTERDIAVAQYEKAIQTAFREVADGLALAQSLGEERAAIASLASATATALQLAEQRHRAGRDSYLSVLDAERSHYAAAQRLIGARLAELRNRILLYQALGGGWPASSGPGASS